MKSSGSPIAKLAGISSLIAAPLFATILILLTFAESDFMRTLGWDPLRAPSFDWPSGLSLGPFGSWMTAAFLVGGGATVFFAQGLRRALNDRLGPGLLSLAGVGLAGLAFATDPTRRATAATWHGRLHDLSFVVLSLTLIPAMVLLGRAFRRLPAWRGLALYTWASAALAVPAIVLRGATFYLFLLAVLAWYEVVAWRLTTTGGKTYPAA